MFGKNEKKHLEEDKKPKPRYIMKEMQYIYGDLGVVLFVDTQTGVNYMMSTKGGELTVAVDEDGEPIVDEGY